MKVLWIHVTPLTQLGGAEIGIRSRIDHAPDGTEIHIVSPEESPSLNSYDALFLGNLRPPGGLGEVHEVKWVEKWTKKLKHFKGFSLKIEHDLHPCAHRDARCISFNPIRKLPCECGPLITTRVQELYNSCTAVQFLSPAHQTVINCLVKIRADQYVIAPPIDLNHFRSTTPISQRKAKALILGDSVRVADSAKRRAADSGFEVEELEYLSVPYAEMPGLYNQYQAVVMDPFMFHAFGRIAVEAKSCGCEVIASDRVGALSWQDPEEACRRSNQEFWGLVENRTNARLNWLGRLRRIFS